MSSRSSVAWTALRLSVVIVLVLVWGTHSYEPPRMQVRYNRSFLDVPDGYKPYPFRTQIWYRYLYICSNLVIHMDLTNMGQGDGAVVVRITDCYMCDGVSIQIRGWGTGLHDYDAPASFSRPVHVNISNNIMNSVLEVGAIHIIGVFPARSTFLIANNMFTQTFTSSTNSYTQAFVHLEGVWLRQKTQLVITDNVIRCQLPMTASDPAATCAAVLAKEGLRLEDNTQITFTKNTVQLGADTMAGLYMYFSDTFGAMLRLTRFTTLTISHNTFDLVTYPTALALNVAPTTAVAVFINADVVEVSQTSSVLSLQNVYRTPAATSVNAGWYTYNNGIAGMCVITVSSRSTIIVSTDSVVLSGAGGIAAVDGLFATSTASTLSITDHSSVVLESLTLTVTASAAGGGVKSLLSLGSATVVDATSALWFDNNRATFDTTGPTASYTMLNIGKYPTSISTTGDTGFVVRESTCTNCGTFYTGGPGSSASARISAMTERCNVLNGATTSASGGSLLTVPILTTKTCVDTCINGVDCFAPNTASVAIVSLTCQCTCTTAAAALPTYGGHCLPGGVVMSLPLMFSSTVTLTISESNSQTHTYEPTNSTTLDPTQTAAHTASRTSSTSSSPSATSDKSLTPSDEPSLSLTITATETNSVSPESTRSTTLSVSGSTSPSTSYSQSTSTTADDSKSYSLTIEETATWTTTSSLSNTTSLSSSSSKTQTSTVTKDISMSFSMSRSSTVSPTISMTNVASDTFTTTDEQTFTLTATYSYTNTSNVSVTETHSGGTPSGTSDETLTETYGTVTEDKTKSATKRHTVSPSRNITPTANVTVSITQWLTPTHRTVTRSNSLTNELTSTMSLTDDKSPTLATLTDRNTNTRTMSMSITTTESITQEDTFTISTTPTKSPSSAVTRSPSMASRTGTLTSWATSSATMTQTVTLTDDLSPSVTNTSIPTVTPSSSLSNEHSYNNMSDSVSRTGTVSTTIERNSMTLYPTKTPTLSNSTSRDKSSSMTKTTTSTITRDGQPPRSRTAQLTDSMTTTETGTVTNILSPSATKQSTHTLPPTRATGTLFTMSSNTVTMTDDSHSLEVTLSHVVLLTETATLTLTVPHSTASSTEDVTPTETVSISISDPVSVTRSHSIDNSSVTETGTERVTLSKSVTETSPPTATFERSQTHQLTSTLTDAQTATLTETLLITPSLSKSQAPSSGTVTVSPDSKTLLFSDSRTKTDSIGSAGIVGRRLGAGIHGTRSTTATLTPSLGSNALMVKGKTGEYQHLSTTVTMWQTPSRSISRSFATATVMWTSSESSDTTLTVTRTITPPPTPSRTPTSSLPPLQSGNFGSFFNLFFVSNLSFNDCTWGVTYILGPIMLLLLVVACISLLWAWGCCEVCCRTNHDDEVRVDQPQASVLRSLFALTTFASLLRPCHMKCWFLHVAHFALHSTVLLLVFLWLAYWLNFNEALTAFTTANASVIALLVALSVLAAQFTRPIYIYLSYQYSWDPAMMEAAWREAVNMDERYRMYQASDDDDEERAEKARHSAASDGEVEGVVVVPTHTDMDALEGFAPLYDGENLYDDISSSTGSDVSDAAAGEVAFEVTETNLDEIIKFHMEAPKENAAQLYQTFKREQKERKAKNDEIDAEANAAANAIHNDDAVEREAAARIRKGVLPVDAMAASVLKLRRKARKASKQVRERRGSSSVAFDIVVEDDVDVGGLIEQYQSMRSPPELPASGIRKTQQELEDIRLGRDKHGSAVDQLIQQHLTGATDEAIDSTAFDGHGGTIQEVRRREKHREARRMRSAEQAVVENLLDQHQKGMELAAIDAEVGLLPEVDFLAEEDFDRDRGKKLGEEGKLKPLPDADAIRDRVRNIVGARSTIRASSREKKTEADLLIEAHLHGETLDTLDTIEERERRRQERIDRDRRDSIDPARAAAEDDVANLLNAFTSGHGPSDQAAPSGDNDVRVGDVMSAFLDDPHAFSNAMKEAPAKSNDAELTVSSLLMSHLAAPQSQRAAENSGIEDLISAHLNGTANRTEEAATVDDLMRQQLEQDRDASERARMEREQHTLLSAELDDLMALHMGEQRRADKSHARVEDDVDDVLSYFQGGGTEPPTTSAKKKEKKKAHKKGKKAQHGQPPLVVPTIAISSHDEDASSRLPFLHNDMIRATVPRLDGLAPLARGSGPVEDLVSPRPMMMMSELNADASNGLLHASSPFASRRLALETPRSSPSATPRIQRYTDVYSGNNSDAAAPDSPAFDRHMIQNSVELLPDDDALTPQPRVGPEAEIPKGVEDWIVLRRTGEGYDDVEDGTVGSVDADALLEEDNALIRHDLGDIDLEDMSEGAVKEIFSRPSTKDSRPGTFESHTFTLVSSLFVSSSDEGESTTVTFGTPKATKRVKKPKRSKRKGVPSLPRRNSRPDDDYLALHTAMSPSSADEATSRPVTGGTETGSRPPLVSKGSHLSLSVLDKAKKDRTVAPPPPAAPTEVDGIEIPSLNSSMMSSHQGRGAALPLHSMEPQLVESDEGDTETNSSVDHLYEKHCGVDMTGGEGGEEKIFVDLPISTHHVGTAFVLIALIVVCLFGLYRVLGAIGDAPMCYGLRWEVILVLFLVDMLVADPISMLVAYAYRYIRSDERNSIWRELHPYHGELRPVLLPPLRSKYVGMEEAPDEFGAAGTDDSNHVEPFDKTTPLGTSSSDGGASHSSVNSFRDILTMDARGDGVDDIV